MEQHWAHTPQLESLHATTTEAHVAWCLHTLQSMGDKYWAHTP